MFDLTMQMVVMRAFAVVIVAVVQGCAVAAAAVALGDRGPKYDGRLSLSPAAHVDALGAASLVLFGLGWARPVAVDASLLRPGRAGLVVVVLAATAALVLTSALLAALVSVALTSLPAGSAALTLAAFLRVAAGLCLACAVFGLVPLTPLVGGHLLGLAGIRIPEKWHWIGGLAALALAASGLAQGFVRPVAAAVARWVGV